MRIYEAGEEFISVEIDADMTLEGAFVAMAAADALENFPGLIEAYPTNASLLIRFDPETTDYDALTARVEQLVTELSGQSLGTLETRVLDVPVWFNDPASRAVAMKFRANHQNPEVDDVTYAASINNCAGPEDFLRKYYSRAWFVSCVGFVAGLPFLFQLTPREEQLEVPKYLRPRTDTLPLTLGHGGCFGAIYSVRGGGGYQIIGLCAAPIFDPGATRGNPSLPDFAETPVLYRTGDIVKYRPIGEEEYNEIQKEVAAGTYTYKIRPFTFSLKECLEDYEAYNRKIEEVLR